MDLDLNLMTVGAETAVTPIRGREENPHRTEDFLTGELTTAFSKKYCGDKKPEKWLEKWLNAPHIVFGCSPKQAIKNGHLKAVEAFIEKTLR